MIASWLAGDTSITKAKARKLRVCADCPFREGINTEPSTFKTIEIPLDRKFIDYCKRNIGVSVKRARELTIAQREDPGIIITRERGDELHVFMIDGHHRAVRRWRDGLRQMKVFIVAEQVGELWRIKDTTLIALTETSKGKTFEEDRDLHHDHGGGP